MFKNFEDIQKYYNLKNNPYIKKTGSIYLKLCSFSNHISLEIMCKKNSSFSTNILLVLIQKENTQNIVDTGIKYDNIQKLTPQKIQEDAIKLVKKDTAHVKKIYENFLKLKNLRKFIKIQNLKDKL